MPQCADPVQLGQVQVENDHVIVRFGGGRSRQFAVGENVHRIVFALKALANEFGQRFIIFRYKDSHRCKTPLIKQPQS